MARMIPGFIDEHSPPGERHVFGLLAKGPSSWTVIHSLDIAPWNHRRRAEVDFLVVIPDVGLLCIEVKSHEAIWVEDGTWYPASITKSPFGQALDARYALVRGLEKVWPTIEDIPVGHICIFPFADFALEANISVKPYELLDRRAMQYLDTGSAFCETLRCRLKEALADGQTRVQLREPLSAPKVDNLIERCLPIRKRRPNAKDESERRQQDLERLLRDQQKPILRLADTNDRLLVTGGAGTGKTLIAIELAQRAADRGLRVALLCFNQLIGEWMRCAVAPARPNLVVGRAIATMADMAGIPIPQSPDRSFWDDELLSRLEERLTDPDFKAEACFDCLILDEAQDILSRPRLWDCLGQFISGGVLGGRYVLLGDLEGQVLSDARALTGSIDDLLRYAHPVRWSLSDNCRNYGVVGQTALLLSGMRSDLYDGYLRAYGSIPQNYDIEFYSDNATQLQLLEGAIRIARQSGFPNRDITLLSFRSDHHAVTSHLRSRGFKVRRPLEPGDAIAACSVHAFKGLESRVVIIADVDLAGHDFERHLLYTALTRATERAHVLCSKSSEGALLAWCNLGEKK